jgi:hypothetical protein
MEFITDRTDSFTRNEYTRHRKDCTMNLVGDDPTEETEGTAREIKL